MSRHKVLQNIQTFTEIGLNGQLNGTSCGVRHQSPHTCKLFNLLIRTTGTGIRHHKDVVISVQSSKEGCRQLIVRLFPGLYNLFVTLLVRNQAPLILAHNFIYRILGILNHLRFLRGHSHIGYGYGHSRPGGIFVTNRFNIVQNFRCGCGAVDINNLFQHFLKLLLSHMEIHFYFKFVFRIASVHKSQILGNDFIK